MSVDPGVEISYRLRILIFLQVNDLVYSLGVYNGVYGNRSMHFITSTKEDAQVLFRTTLRK